METHLKGYTTTLSVHVLNPEIIQFPIVTSWILLYIMLAAMASQLAIDIYRAFEPKFEFYDMNSMLDSVLDGRFEKIVVQRG